MHAVVVNVEEEIAEQVVQVFQRPDCVLRWMCAFGGFTGVLEALGVALQVRKYHGVRAAEKLFDDRTKARSRRRPFKRIAPVSGEEGLVKRGIELLAIISHDGLGETPKPSNAIP